MGEEIKGGNEADSGASTLGRQPYGVAKQVMYKNTVEETQGVMFYPPGSPNDLDVGWAGVRERFLRQMGVHRHLPTMKKDTALSSSMPWKSFEVLKVG